MTEEERQQQIKELVSISIFRAGKNEELFNKMEENGNLVRDFVPGIYHVKGITDLPFQIIITSELCGEEYASYRAMTDRADEADVESIIKNVENEKDYVMLDHYGVLLDLVVEKNPKFFNLVRGRNQYERSSYSLNGSDRYGRCGLPRVPIHINKGKSL